MPIVLPAIGHRSPPPALLPRVLWVSMTRLGTETYHYHSHVLVVTDLCVQKGEVHMISP